MNRRQFLRRALIGVPLIVAPAIFLEEISRPKIFLPPRGGWPDQVNDWNYKYLWSVNWIKSDSDATIVGKFNGQWVLQSASQSGG